MRHPSMIDDRMGEFVSHNILGLRRAVGELKVIAVPAAMQRSPSEPAHVDIHFNLGAIPVIGMCTQLFQNDPGVG